MLKKIFKKNDNPAPSLWAGTYSKSPKTPTITENNKPLQQKKGPKYYFFAITGPEKPIFAIQTHQKTGRCTIFFSFNNQYF